MSCLSVPFLGQGQGLPTGCESVSAVMLLRFLGLDMDPETFVRAHLPCAPFYRDPAGLWHGPDPRRAFVGDPHDPEALGCYAPVMVQALTCAAPGFRAVDESGTELERLCLRYVERGLPLLLWCSIGLRPTVNGPWYLLEPEGRPFMWISNEHCVLLAGRDDTHYFCYDPWQDRGLVSCPRRLLWQRHRELGMQAVALVPEAWPCL